MQGDFRKPLYLTHAGDERVFVVEQDGGLTFYVAPNASSRIADAQVEQAIRKGAQWTFQRPC